MMEFKDYYAVLGLPPDADDSAIKAAYRKLARRYHPDVSTHADAENQFKEVAQAYRVLHNREKRSEYDALRAAHLQQKTHRAHANESFDGSASTDAEFSSFFNSIFGAAGAPGNRYQNPDSFAQKGQDVEIELPMLLEETLAESFKPIQFQLSQPDQQGQLQTTTKSLKVRIPAGVRDGDRIRLKGQGASGLGNAPNGDLYLHIRLVPHPVFDIEGHNLIMTVPLAPWEAALGHKVTVPTLTGSIQLTIPPNSQSGQRLRIKGKGLSVKNGQGDLIAILKVVMPETVNATMKDLWSKLAQASDFDPRAEWSK